MKKQFARAVLAAALLCSSAGAAMMVSTAPAYAEEHVSRAVGTKLNDAVKAIQGKDYATAAQALKDADGVSDKSDYDVLKIDQIKGYLAIQQQDYTSAATAYEAVIASPAFDKLEPAEQQTTLRNGMILSAQQKHWPQVIATGKKLEAMKALDSKSFTVMAQAYYLTNDFPNAQSYAQKSIDAAKAAGQTPEKAALQIVMSAQVKDNDQGDALKTLEQLAVDYNSPDDWGRLIDMAMGIKGIDELDALYLYRLRFLSGATAASDDYSIAAGIAVHQGYPMEAKGILEKGLGTGVLSDSGKTRSLLSKARSDARADERSLSSIAKMAASSKYGEQDVKLAEDYWGYGRYQDAITAAKRGIAKGHIKDATEGDYILGIAQVAAGQYADGQATLAKVDGNAARARGAQLWSLYAKSKMQAAQAKTPAAAPQQ